MAKSRVNNEDEEVKSNSDKASIEESTDYTDVVAAISTAKKNVKIRVVEEIDCLISCKPYKFAKDKEVSVPSDVAAILCFAKKAYRL